MRQHHIFLAFVLLSLALFLPRAGVTAETREILLLFSYDSRDDWSESILDGVREVLAVSPEHLHTEHLDARNIHDRKSLDHFGRYIFTKYAAIPFEAVIVADNAALDFVLDNRSFFHPDLPVIFCGINNFSPAILRGEKSFTGVNEAIDIPGSVNLALQLFPRARQLVVVAGSTGVGAVNFEAFRQSMPSFSRPIDISILMDLRRDDLDETIARLPADTLILRLENLIEPDGTRTPLKESMRLLSQHSPCPVFSLWDFDMGSGAFGGVVVNGRNQGMAAGRLAREVFAGRRPEALPVIMDSPNTVTIDYHQMARFGISPEALPRSAAVINRPVSFYERNKRLIYGTLALFALMAAGILSLTAALLARRKAERALRASEERYRMYVDGSPSGIFIADAYGRFLDVNPEICRLTGYTREDFFTMGVKELLLEPDADFQHFHRPPPERHGAVEVRVRTRGGEAKWWSVSATRVSDGTIMATVVDVTVRRNQEEVRTIFGEFLDNADHIAVFKDTDLRYVMVNRAYTALTGLGTEDICGKTDREAFEGLSTPEQIEAYIANDRQALALPRGQIISVEEETLAADGTVRTFLTKKFPVYARDGRLLGTGVITSEITADKQAKRRLEDSLGLLGRIMNAIPADIYVMDPQSYHILFTNKGMEERFGPGLTGNLCWQALRGETGPCSYCRLGKLLADNGPKTAIWEEHNAETGRTYFNLDTLIDWPDGRRVKLQVASDVTELNRVREALANSERHLRAVFDQAAIGICQLAPDGGFLQVNPKCCAIFGYAEEELILLNWRDLIHPDDLPPGESEVGRLLADKRDCLTLENRYRRKDGTIIWASVNISLCRNPEGTLLYFIACIEETSQRHHDAEVMRTAADIIAHIPSGLFVYDYVAPDRLYLRDANPEAARLTGITTEQWAGREFNEIWPAAEQLHIKERFLQPFTSGEMFETESVSYEDDELSGAYRVRTFLLPENRLAVAFEDVTERLRAEQEVAASREQLRQVIDLVPHFIYAKDLDGRFLLANRALAEAFGTTAEELGGKADSEIVTDEEELCRRREEDRAVVESGAAKRIEDEVFVDARGEERILSTVKMPFSLSGSNCPAVLSVSVDNTEKVRGEAEKRQLTAQLHQAQKMEAIGTLAGGIAHDFNNILTAIIGYAEMIRDDSPPESPTRHDIDQVLSAGLRAKELVRQILAFSRHSETRPIPLQLGVIINEAVKLIRASLPTTIAVKCELDKHAGLVTADPTQIHQIIMNLATNAFHAMEKSGGTLTITLRDTTLGEDVASRTHLPPGDYVLLSVGDTGTGISPAIINNIFDPYFTTKEKGRGTGLGLATVHGIVRSCGGGIHCESRLGEGTVFSLLFPAATATPPAAADEAEMDETGNGHILFVDDEPMLIDMGRTILERIGYRVTSRASSLEALTTFQDQPEAFDLVITDLTMPGMTGIDLARRLLQIRPELPILLCTGYSNLISEEKALAMGIKGFAMKPLAKKELATRIRDILGR